MKKKTILKLLLLFIVLIFIGVNIFIYVKDDQEVAVLGYHGILPEKMNVSNSEFIINMEDFEKQLQYLQKHNYKTLTLEEFYCWKMKKCKKPHKAVLITFDDGYKNNYDYAFPLLKKYNMNAVVFVIGKNLEADGSRGYLTMEDIEKAREEYPNIEFASHSYNKHEDRTSEYNEVSEDLKKMSEIYETQYFAYPHGDYTEEYIKALKEYNYKMAFTFGPEHRKAKINDNEYKVPRLNIYKELPSWKFKLLLFLP